ncbi:hypothetical protein D3C84_1132210 [compost metagenome]
MVALEERGGAYSTRFARQFLQSVLVGTMQPIQIGDVGGQGFDAERMQGIALVQTSAVAAGECAQDCFTNEVGHQQQANG